MGIDDEDIYDGGAFDGVYDTEDAAMLDVLGLDRTPSWASQAVRRYLDDLATYGGGAKLGSAERNDQHQALVGRLLGRQWRAAVAAAARRSLATDHVARWRADRPDAGGARLADAKELGWARSEPTPAASVIRRGDGVCLGYDDADTTVYGAGGVGKSLLGNLVIKQVLDAGGHAIQLDYESELNLVHDQLANLLGADADALATRWHYVKMTGPLAAVSEQLDAADVRFADDVPRLVVVDSVGRSMKAAGLNPLVEGDYMAWVDSLAALVEAHLDGWACRFLIDHDTGAGKLTGPSGTSRKTYEPTGSMYRVANVRPFSRTRSGGFDLVCVKDRRGTFARDEVAARLEVTAPLPGGVEPARVELLAPVEPASAAEVADRVEALLKARGRSSLNQLRKELVASGAGVKYDTLCDAVGLLVGRGVATESVGPRKSRVFELRE